MKKPIFAPLSKLPFHFYHGLFSFLFFIGISIYCAVSNGIYYRKELFSGLVILEIIYYILLIILIISSLVYLYVLRNKSQKYMLLAAFPAAFIILLFMHTPGTWGFLVGSIIFPCLVFGVLPMAWIHPKAYEEYPERYRGGSEE